MINIKEILVGYDFSKYADQALIEAGRMARKTDARLHIVYVEVMHRDLNSMEVNAATRSDRLKSDLMHRWATMTEESNGLFAEVEMQFAVLRDVSAGAALLEYAAEEDIDLVVVGTHGRRGLRRMLMGSVAEEVVRKATCPVMTIKANGEGGDGFHRSIIAPVDFSKHSIRAVRHAKEIAGIFDYDVVLMHVLEEQLHPAFYNTGTFSQYEYDPNIEHRANEALSRVYDEAGGPDVRVHYLVKRGNAVQQIVAVAREHSPSMIVMATHGLTGIDHFLMGSVSEKVVRHSDVPVFTVKSFGRQLTDEPTITTSETAPDTSS
jgi:nucleotide-binding universal stress UspA family protein